MRQSTTFGLAGLSFVIGGVSLFDWRVGLIVAGGILFAMGVLTAIEERQPK